MLATVHLKCLCLCIRVSFHSISWHMERKALTLAVLLHCMTRTWCMPSTVRQVSQQVHCVHTSTTYPPYSHFLFLYEGVLLWRGYTLDQVMDQCFCNRHDAAHGREMPVHYGSKEFNYQFISSPLATQMPQGTPLVMEHIYLLDGTSVTSVLPL